MSFADYGKLSTQFRAVLTELVKPSSLLGYLAPLPPSELGIVSRMLRPILVHASLRLLRELGAAAGGCARRT